MPPLPRGRCPVCRADIALRKGGELREHRDQTHELYGTGQSDQVPICAGSGRQPHVHDGSSRGCIIGVNGHLYSDGRLDLACREDRGPRRRWAVQAMWGELAIAASDAEQARAIAAEASGFAGAVRPLERGETLDPAGAGPLIEDPA